MKHTNVVLIYLTALPLLTLLLASLPADGEEGDLEGLPCPSAVWRGAQRMQPWFHGGATLDERARRAQHLRELTDAVCAASQETGIDPLLALAVAFRESSLNPRVGLGKKNGSRGERGYFQVMPGSPAERFRPGECSQHEPSCNATSALGFMRHLHETCGTSPWQWLGAYGRGSCPSVTEAQEWEEVQVARRFFCKLAPGCAEVWPE